MDNLIRKKLQDLIARRGQGLCLEPDRCKAAVKELCDRHPVEQFVLASIVDLGMLAPILELSDPGSWRDLASELTGRLQDAGNPWNRWQGSLRCGWLDLPLLGYAADVAGPLDGIVVNHLDQVETGWLMCEAYRSQ